jgi:hypothetical protein
MQTCKKMSQAYVWDPSYVSSAVENPLNGSVIPVSTPVAETSLIQLDESEYVCAQAEGDLEVLCTGLNKKLERINQDFELQKAAIRAQVDAEIKRLVQEQAKAEASIESNRRQAIQDFTRYVLTEPSTPPAHPSSSGWRMWPFYSLF